MFHFDLVLEIVASLLSQCFTLHAGQSFCFPSCYGTVVFMHCWINNREMNVSGQHCAESSPA